MQTLSTHVCLLAAEVLELGISGFESFIKGFSLLIKLFFWFHSPTVKVAPQFFETYTLIFRHF